MNQLVRNLAVLVAAIMLWMPGSPGNAAEYPSKPITLVAPYGPGGASDLHARIIAGAAPAYLKQAVLVINKTGAAGVVGSTYVVKGKKDGYTLLSARVGSQAGVPAMNPHIPYKWDEFTFLGLTERNPFVLVVKKDSPYKTFQEFEKALKGGGKARGAGRRPCRFPVAEFVRRYRGYPGRSGNPARHNNQNQI